MLHSWDSFSPFPRSWTPNVQALSPTGHFYRRAIIHGCFISVKAARSRAQAKYSGTLSFTHAMTTGSLPVTLQAPPPLPGASLRRPIAWNPLGKCCYTHLAKRHWRWWLPTVCRGAAKYTTFTCTPVLTCQANHKHEGHVGEITGSRPLFPPPWYLLAAIPKSSPKLYTWMPRKGSQTTRPSHQNGQPFQKLACFALCWLTCLPQQRETEALMDVAIQAFGASLVLRLPSTGDGAFPW